MPAIMMRASRTGMSAFAAACAFSWASYGASASDPQEKAFDLAIMQGSLSASQRLMRVEKDDSLRWRSTTYTPGELHLHAYRLQAKVEPGKPAEIAFRAFATGRYRIEWHSASGKADAAGAHRAPPLAILEVRPR